MAKRAIPPAPSGLLADSRDVWRKIHTGWQLDDSARVLLTIHLRAADRAATARALIATDGLVITSGGKGSKGSRPHPAVTVLRDAETTMLRAWRALALDVPPQGPMGRPPGGGPA